MYTVEALQREFEETINAALATGASSFCKKYSEDDIPNVIHTLAAGLGIRKEELVGKFNEAMEEHRTTTGGDSRRYPRLSVWFLGDIPVCHFPAIIISELNPSE